MTNEQIWKIALQQSAYDCNCNPEDFISGINRVTRSQAHPKARKYLTLPCACDMVCYGSNVVAQTSERLAQEIEAYIQKYPVEHCFDVPNLYVLDGILQKYGQRVCYLAEYFLPDVTKIREMPCSCELRVLHHEDFAQLYKPEWSNALCRERSELDILGVGAYDQGKLIGLAGCSADGEEMYQIGVDVLEPYRRQGVASALISRLAMETLKLGKVPFYCAAWCNVKSVRSAIRCGFRPAWVQLTAKDCGFVEEMNR